MASMALLIKVHKKNLPGRAYLSQIDAPSYKICQELTRVMNPIDKKGESFIQDTYHFQEVLSNFGVWDKDFVAIAGCCRDFFTNIPLKKTQKVVRQELENDYTLQIWKKWESDDIMKHRRCLQATSGSFICIGLKELMYLLTIISSRIILCFGIIK